MFENYQDVSWELCARCPRADWGINISLECSGTSSSDIKCRIFGNVSCNTCVRVCSPVRAFVCVCVCLCVRVCVCVCVCV